MSSLHLSIGSTQPAKVEGKLRLYSMEFCPFAQRVRLILLAKNIPHDIVNINLIKKPEWYFNIHPEAKVPALDIGSKIIVESLDIVDFLDAEYPDPPLYPAEPTAKQQDQDLIKKIGPLNRIFANICYKLENKTPAEWLKEFRPHLDVLEEEICQRGDYFGGAKPGMVDYMLWPLAERAAVITLVLGERIPFEQNEYPKLRAWRKLMRKNPVVNEIYNEPEKNYKVLLFKTEGLTPDYDSI